MSNRVPIIGVTGGIGSGKSTLCRWWKNWGVFLLDADAFAKKLMVSDPETIKALKKAFGEASYLSDGSLNRAYIAKCAFEHGRVEELNAIVHPVLFSKSKQELNRAAQTNDYPFVVKEAALLLKYGRPDYLDKVVLVRASRQNRIQRVMKRDNAVSEEIEKRMVVQQDFDSLAKYADIVIENDTHLEAFEAKAKHFFELLREK